MVTKYHTLFYLKIAKKRELQQIAWNRSTDNELKDIMKFYNVYNIEPYSILVNDTALPSHNQSSFRKNLL